MKKTLNNCVAGAFENPFLLPKNSSSHSVIYTTHRKIVPVLFQFNQSVWYSWIANQSDVLLKSFDTRNHPIRLSKGSIISSSSYNFPYTSLFNDVSLSFRSHKVTLESKFLTTKRDFPIRMPQRRENINSLILWGISFKKIRRSMNSMYATSNYKFLIGFDIGRVFQLRYDL